MKCVKLYCHVELKAHLSACLSLCVTASVDGKAAGTQPAFLVEQNLVQAASRVCLYKMCDVSSKLESPESERKPSQAQFYVSVWKYSGSITDRLGRRLLSACYLPVIMLSS